ncbi:hypothetical protein LPJ61_001125 [Coemansia biformis]|uniref:Conserved oligomeric Golgi complex subunit 7 n=1 Tax=Coemansia biformis TaxID=1286918 RepID=A0A9W8CZW1_9FUNG|nr:hypothetical protein LPJ61_001125 [Coemansia biformis]
MDISLDAFSSPQFDAKGWINQQFAALDTGDVFDAPAEEGAGAGPESLAQRLATQLHFLATNAQQNSDRIKARFRHQAAQIARDIAALGRLVQVTRQRMAAVADAVEAQQASALAVRVLVDIGTVKHRVEGAVSALDYLRSYTNLPEKISALMADGELARAWELVDAMGPGMCPAAGAPGALGVDEAQSYGAKIQAAVAAELCRAAAADDTEAAARASRLLVEHGRGDVVETEVLRLRSEHGSEQLRQAMSEEGLSTGTGDLRAILGAVLALVVADRALVEAVDVPSPDALLEDLLSCYTESILPCVRRAVAHAQHDADPRSVLDLHQALAGLYGELLSAATTSTLSVGDSSAAAQGLMDRPIPRSLRLLFGPLAGYIGGLADHEADQIRKGSLQRLRAIEAESGRIEPFVRDASRAIAGVFEDIEQALDRIFEFVPPSRLGDAVAAIAAPALDVGSYLHDKLADASKSMGVPVADLTGFSRLCGLEDAGGFTDAVHQPLTSEGKLGTVSSCIGLSLLCHVFERCSAATFASIDRRWRGLAESLARMGFGAADDGATTAAAAEPAKALIVAFMDARSTGAEMSAAAARLAAAPPPSGASKVGKEAARLSKTAASAVFFLVTGAFRAPLCRIPANDAWHAVHESRSSMNIVVPQFSCSPSEEAVDIGEKMHILLPELEQVEMMHAQYVRGIEFPADIPPLHTRMLESLVDGGCSGVVPDSSASSPVLEMLLLVLRTVQQGFVDQVCRIAPPLSSHGRQQLASDVEYIASVASSFGSSTAAEFEVLQQVIAEQDRGDHADQLPASETRDKLRLLLQPPHGRSGQ